MEILKHIAPIRCQVCSANNGLPASLLSAAEPVVLKDYVLHWPVVSAAKQGNAALQKLLLSYYNEALVHTMRAPIEGTEQAAGKLFYNEDLSGFNFSRARESLSTVFSQLNDTEHSAQETIYVGSTAVDSVMPGLRDANDLAFLRNKALASIWMGNQTRIAAHYDAPDNIACVVGGTRRFILFPADQLRNLYVGPIDFTPAGQPASLVDFYSPDFDKFPRFKCALQAAQYAELGPGDAIYIPPNWWHHVEALSPFNVLINYWWRQVDDHVGVPNDALLHAILAIKSLPKPQRDAWREIFDYYVFGDHDFSHIPTRVQGLIGELSPDNARKIRTILLNKINR
ncbi:cupin-like domain-containing protein [Glaciecola siphonariae]|uniref:Cupin-like domain-containing protein n=1 Tax=Glaciecola siphonariae TaxID=521012 RepID=A0ABV9LVX7_9ALTE